MKIVTATASSHEEGPLTQTVRRFTAAQGAVLAAGVKSSADYAPVAEFVDVDSFRRVGAYLETFDWDEYTRFLTGWASGGTRFEFTEFRISEIGDSVFQEIEERHHRGGEFIRKNVIAVYRFDADGKIVHLDIYEQATDSGAWIKDFSKGGGAAGLRCGARRWTRPVLHISAGSPRCPTRAGRGAGRCRGWPSARPRRSPPRPGRSR